MIAPTMEILAQAHREYEYSHEAACLINIDGMNYTVFYEDRDDSGRIVFANATGTNNYEDALHMFAVMVNMCNLELTK